MGLGDVVIQLQTIAQDDLRKTYPGFIRNIRENQQGIASEAPEKEKRAVDILESGQSPVQWQPVVPFSITW